MSPEDLKKISEQGNKEAGPEPDQQEHNDVVQEPEYIEPVQIINPTLTNFRVGGKILKLREMNNKKIKLFVEMVADSISDIFGGNRDINIKSADDFKQFFKDVPEAKVNQFINFVFSTKETPHPLSDSFIEEHFTPRLVQILFKEVLRQNELEKFLDFIKGQIPRLLQMGQKTQ